MTLLQLLLTIKPLTTLTMNIEKNTHGLTFVTQSRPWGLYLKNGHRLLCSDGKIRAAELAETADTFFSVPARVRVNGKSVSGYMTVQTRDGSSVETGNNPNAYVFRHHTCHSDALPSWPGSFTKEHAEIMAKAF